VSSHLCILHIPMFLGWFNVLNGWNRWKFPQLAPCARCSFRGKGESTSWVADLSKSCELCKGVVAGTQSHHDLRGFDVLIPIFYLCWCHDLWVRCGHHTNESMTELNPNRKCSST
jgi:hypothetical protein